MIFLVSELGGCLSVASFFAHLQYTHTTSLTESSTEKTNQNQQRNFSPSSYANFCDYISRHLACVFASFRTFFRGKNYREHVTLFVSEESIELLAIIALRWSQMCIRKYPSKFINT